jgi:putative aminopeptidase FrvX
MPVDSLNKALPALPDGLNRLPALNDLETIWDMLRRLLAAHAPTGGANLLGGVGDDIAVLADSLGLRDRVTSHLGSTGNCAIWLGADKPTADLVLTAHMDRPSFRVRSVDDGTLYPICANRFPPGEYRVSAKAVRFDRGRLIVGAEGMIVSHKQDGVETLKFEVKRGKLAWHDTILIAVHPARDGQTIVGTGLDNTLGVLTALLTAAALREIENVMRERERRCVIVFTDQEEGPPNAYFGQGAARLMHTLPPPTYGCIVVDTQTIGPGLEPQAGQGACHGTASRWGEGVIVPPNYHALAVDLAAAMNTQRPATVQLNHGYISRSDDVFLSQWARILALIGPPSSDPHTGYESARLDDIQDTVWWLAYFVAAAINIVPELTPRYALGR